MLVIIVACNTGTNYGVAEGRRKLHQLGEVVCHAEGQTRKRHRNNRAKAYVGYTDNVHTVTRYLSRGSNTADAVAGRGVTDRMDLTDRATAAAGTTDPIVATGGVNGGSVKLTFTGGGSATVFGALPR